MEEFLNSLRERALYIKLEADIRFGGAVDINSLVNALTAINSSFLSFLDAELRNQYKQKITEKVNLEIKALQKESPLLIVDLDFGSFEAGLSPNSITITEGYSHIKNALSAKKEIFDDYKENVFFADVNDPNLIKRFEDRFAPEERSAIFKPIIQNVIHSPRFKFKYGRTKLDVTHSFKAIKEQARDRLVPKISKTQEKEERLYMLYATTSGEFDLFGPKPKFKKILAVEEVEQPIYPLQTKSIECEGTQISLSEMIQANVSYDGEEELFYITYPDLDIMVWGDTREEAEEAFNFTFSQLVDTIYNEDDSNLAPKAKELKNRLVGLIREINT